MTRPIQRTAGATPPPTTSPAQPSAPAGASGAAPSVFEVDVRLAVTGAARVAADGTVVLRREFMTRLVRHLLRKPERFEQTQVHWDAPRGAYDISTTFKLKGLSLPVSARVVPTSENGQVGFRLEGVKVKKAGLSLSGAWVERQVTQALAKELEGSNIRAQVDPKRATILLDASSLLTEIEALPAGATLDAQANRMALDLDAKTGDVTVKLTSGTNVPAAADTPRSDLAVRFDEAALRHMLKGALGQAYDLKDVRFGADGLALKGQAEVKPLSGLVNAGRLLFGLLGDRRALTGPPDRVMIDLDLDIRLAPEGVRLKPSMRQALPELEAALGQTGARFRRDGDSLVIDAASLLPAGVSLEDARMTPEGLLGKIHLDLPEMLHPPILRGER